MSAQRRQDTEVNAAVGNQLMRCFTWNQTTIDDLKRLFESSHINGRHVVFSSSSNQVLMERTMDALAERGDILREALEGPQKWKMIGELYGPDSDEKLAFNDLDALKHVYDLPNGPHTNRQTVYRMLNDCSLILLLALIGCLIVALIN